MALKDDDQVRPRVDLRGEQPTGDPVRSGQVVSTRALASRSRRPVYSRELVLEVSRDLHLLSLGKNLALALLVERDGRDLAPRLEVGLVQEDLDEMVRLEGRVVHDKVEKSRQAPATLLKEGAIR